MSPAVAIVSTIVVLNAVLLWALVARFRWEDRRDAKAEPLSFDAHAESAMRMLGARGPQR